MLQESSLKQMKIIMPVKDQWLCPLKKTIKTVFWKLRHKKALRISTTEKI